MNHTAKSLLKELVPSRYWPQFVELAARARYKLLWFSYQGNTVACPLCGGSFARFLPDRLDIPVLQQLQVTGAGFAAALCPRCHASFRERHLFLYLQEETDLFRGRLRLLHVAPERNLGRLLAVQPNLAYLSADLESPLAMMRMDITDIRLPAGSFDAILCSHVLEHIPDDRRALAELYRVLAPGGWAVLQVPIALSLAQTREGPAEASRRLRLARFGQADHVRLYAPDYRQRLENAGFQVSIYNFARKHGPDLAAYYGIQPEEDIYVASRPLSDAQ